MQQLDADGVQYNSFNNKNTKRRAFIVRGVLGETDNDALQMIEEAIRATGIESDMEISRFVTAYQRHNPSTKRAPLFKVLLPAGVDEKVILDIRTIGYCGVRVEAMKRSGTVQCHNCQRLHHTTNQCHFHYRCVQCIASHDWGKCPRAMSKSIPIGCVNCHDAELDHTEHTANDLQNCNYFKKVQADREKLKKGQQKGERTQDRIRLANGASTSDIRNGPAISNAGIGTTSYASALKTSTSKETKGNEKKSIIHGGNIDLEQLIAMTVRGVLAAINNGV